MDEAFPAVVEPEVLGWNLWASDNGALMCQRCDQVIGIHYGVFSVLHLLYMVKKHLKEHPHE